MRNQNYISYFSTKTYVVGTQKNRLILETVLLSTINKCYNRQASIHKFTLKLREYLPMIDVSVMQRTGSNVYNTI